MSGVWLVLTLTAHAQDYAFPASAADYPEFYPTAYMDHGGETDWDCGGITYAGHDGSDFGGGSFAGMDEGRDVAAAAGGTVIATNDGEFDRCTTGDCAGGGGFGNYVYIEHPDGKVTIYGHLKQWSVAVSVGDVVQCGQHLGQMGSSGYSTGPHLHFQVNGTSGYAEDPFDGPCSFPPTYWLSQGPYAGLPGNVCEDGGACEPAGALTCGVAVSARNDQAGSTQQTWAYGCSGYTYSGPELAWTFTSGIDQPVTLELTGLSADLDLYVLSSPACDGTGCVGASTTSEAADEAVTFDAVAGQEYTVVVDGWEGAVSELTLTPRCVAAPTGDTGPTGTPTGTTGTGTDTDPPDTDGSTSDPRVVDEKPGGCSHAPHAPSAALALTLFLLRRRRCS